MNIFSTGPLRKRPRHIPCDPHGPLLRLLPAAPESDLAVPPGGADPTFALLAAGGMGGERLDRLRLALHYEEPSDLAALCHVCPGQASRQIRALLGRARSILLADALRQGLHASGMALVDAASGEPCDDVRIEDLIPLGPEQRAELRLKHLSRAVRRLGLDPNAGGVFLCAVRLAHLCRVWAARPRVALPFELPAVLDGGGGELPPRRAA